MKIDLEAFGLTDTEAKVYLTLLKQGCVSASIIIKKTQLHRTTIYDVLERLISKGFASHIIKNNKKYYEAAPPSKFIDKAEEQIAESIQKKEIAKNILEDLEKNQAGTKIKSSVKIYEGKEGLKTILDDIINEGKDFMNFGGEFRFKDILPRYTEIWAEKRRQKNIKAKLIGSFGTRAPKWKLNECKGIQKEYFSPAGTLIYGNKVAIILVEEPILIIQIENEKIARSYQNYFTLLWSIAQKSD